jgi:cyanophycin synthetase
MKTVLCIGNPEAQYADTRHNVGWKVADALAVAMGASFAEDGAELWSARGRLAGEDALVVKPRTYVNRTGRAIPELRERGADFGPESFLVVCDDVVLPVGAIRMRRKGSSGGHNGLKSIEAALETDAYARMRLGVGGPEVVATPEFVLGRFRDDERGVVEDTVRDAVAALTTWATDGIDRAMSRHNRAEPPKLTPRIPVVSVTGTNGKTTTTRCIAHILACAGRRVGRADSNGVWIGTRQVLIGDFIGPQGARRVLDDPWPDVAVLETGRGGILRHGIGYEWNDVTVVTNVTADHLGLLGVESVEEMAEVKSRLVRVTRAEGAVVLNADDANVRAMAAVARAPVTLVSRAPTSAPVVAHLAAGGRAVLADDGTIVLAEGSRRTRLVAIADLPMTCGGALVPMVEDALAAAAAALGLGVTPEDVARGLRTFHNSPQQNPGRLNVVRLRRPERTLVIDHAHDTVAVGHLLDFAERLRAPGGRLVVVVSAPGDRRDEDLEAIGRLVGARADWVWTCHRTETLRGRTPESMAACFAAGIRSARGGDDGYASAGEAIDGLRRAVTDARARDVVVMMYCKEFGAALDALGIPREGRWRRVLRRLASLRR